MIMKIAFNKPWLVGLASCLLAACGGAASAGREGQDSAARGFVVGSRIWDDTSITSYFNVVASLDQATSVDLDEALEVAGAAKLYAVEGSGWFAVGGGEEPTIT